MLEKDTIARRRPIRMTGFDYSLPGAYFVTICTQGRKPVFGGIKEGQMLRNEFGEIAFSAWTHLPQHYPYVELDEFVVMPDHFHGIIVIHEDIVVPGIESAQWTEPQFTVGAGLKPAPTRNGQPKLSKTDSLPQNTKNVRHGLPEIVRGFKTFSARRINEIRGIHSPLWQRGYYDHIIRGEDELAKIRLYIGDNPLNRDENEEIPLWMTRPQAS